MIYGVHPVIETIRQGKRLVYSVFLARGPGIPYDLEGLLEDTSIPVNRLTAEQMVSATGSPHHQGIAAQVGPFPYVEFDDLLVSMHLRAGPIVLLDGVQDPGNLGSILRSAECLGACAVILTRDRSAPITPAVEKASSGASAHMPVARVVNLVRAIQHLRKADYWMYATVSTGGTDYSTVDLTGRTAIILGSEGKGIRRLVRENCDAAMSIPMTGKIGALSVSQAGAILLAESLRQRTSRPVKGHGKETPSRPRV